MKLFCFALICSFVAIQPKADLVEQTVALIRQNNVKELVKSFTPTIELTILNDDNVYSRTQAETALNNFFAKNPPESIKIIHRVDSNPDLRFAVALLTTRNGNFRTSFSLKSINGACQISELRIEEEKAK